MSAAQSPDTTFALDLIKEYRHQYVRETVCNRDEIKCSFNSSNLSVLGSICTDKLINLCLRPSLLSEIPRLKNYKVGCLYLEWINGPVRYPFIPTKAMVPTTGTTFNGSVKRNNKSSFKSLDVSFRRRSPEFASSRKAGHSFFITRSKMRSDMRSRMIKDKRNMQIADSRSARIIASILDWISNKWECYQASQSRLLKRSMSALACGGRAKTNNRSVAISPKNITKKIGKMALNRIDGLEKRYLVACVR